MHSVKTELLIIFNLHNVMIALGDTMIALQYIIFEKISIQLFSDENYPKLI